MIWTDLIDAVDRYVVAEIDNANFTGFSSGLNGTVTDSNASFAGLSCGLNGTATDSNASFAGLSSGLNGTATDSNADSTTDPADPLPPWAYALAVAGVGMLVYCICQRMEVRVSVDDEAPATKARGVDLAIVGGKRR